MTSQYRFVCPHCSERTIVDGEVLELLLAEGCVVCERPVTRSAFDTE